MRSAIHVTGRGAVSSAGWGVEPMYDAVMAGTPLPFMIQKRSEGAPESRVRKVPALSPAPDWMKHNRMRRTTVAARHAVGAAMQALGPERLAKAQSQDPMWRVGVIFCTMNGCVQFSRRFFAEALQDPKLASPILFPETVHNAPASHIAALLGSPEMNYTLVGDSSQFLRGLDMGAMWLDDGQVDAALVVAAEELDWVTDEAMLLFHREGIVAEGAAAVLLERRADIEPAGPGAAGDRRTVALAAVTEAHTYGKGLTMTEAARRMQIELEDATKAESQAEVVLFDGRGAGPKVDPAEIAAWAGWNGGRVSVRPVLGEGYGVTGGWQTVIACESVARGTCKVAMVSGVGLGEQAVGAVLAAGASGAHLTAPG